MLNLETWVWIIFLAKISEILIHLYFPFFKDFSGAVSYLFLFSFLSFPFLSFLFLFFFIFFSFLLFFFFSTFLQRPKPPWPHEPTPCAPQPVPYSSPSTRARPSHRTAAFGRHPCHCRTPTSRHHEPPLLMAPRTCCCELAAHNSSEPPSSIHPRATSRHWTSCCSGSITASPARLAPTCSLPWPQAAAMVVPTSSGQPALYLELPLDLSLSRLLPVLLSFLTLCFRPLLPSSLPFPFLPSLFIGETPLDSLGLPSRQFSRSSCNLSVRKNSQTKRQWSLSVPMQIIPQRCIFGPSVSHAQSHFI